MFRASTSMRLNYASRNLKYWFSVSWPWIYLIFWLFDIVDIVKVPIYQDIVNWKWKFISQLTRTTDKVYINKMPKQKVRCIYFQNRITMHNVVLQHDLNTMRWNTNLISHPFNLLPNVYIQNTEIKKTGFISVYITKGMMEIACTWKITTTNKLLSQSEN